MTTEAVNDTIQDDAGDPRAHAWRGFTPGAWCDAIDVRGFIQANYTPYEGDDSFLEGATERTTGIWDKLSAMFPEEREKGVYDVDFETPALITSHGPGYIDQDNELIVGLQTDAPLKRAIMPFGGWRMVVKELETYGYPVKPELEEIFSKYRKTHNDGVFDAYPPNVRAARSSHIVTGLPDAYGRGPDRSYIAGGSNGGRHTMVASARYADEYDGFLAIAPGFNLPQAAVAQIWGAQQWATVATDTANLATAFTQAERELVAQAVIDRCDGLDRLRDGQVLDMDRCQELFSIDADVPTCDADRDGSCLTEEQKAVIRSVFAGATTSDGAAIYSSFPLGPGITQGSWGFWKFTASVQLDPLAVGTVFGTPPAYIADPLAFDVDAGAAAIYATTDVYTESGMEFATPPDPTSLDTLRDRGAKMIVVHGTADGVFSSDDTAAWYDELDAAYRQKAEEFVRYFEVPAMGHVRGGPATDQFDGLGALVAWVEKGDAPDRIIATARGEGNAGGVNAEVPADWSADRSRPLCPYPLVARYRSGDPEVAASFVCKASGGGIGTAKSDRGGASGR